MSYFHDVIFFPRHTKLHDNILICTAKFSTLCMCCMHARCRQFAFLHARSSSLHLWKHEHTNTNNPRLYVSASCCLTLHVCLSLFPPSGNDSVVKPCISPIRPDSIPLNHWRVLSQQALVRSRVRPQWKREKETLTILRFEAVLFLLVVWLMRERPRLNKSPQLRLATF